MDRKKWVCVAFAVVLGLLIFVEPSLADHHEKAGEAAASNPVMDVLNGIGKFVGDVINGIFGLFGGGGGEAKAG